MTQLALLRGFNQIAGRVAPEWTARRARVLFTHPRRLPRKAWEAPVEASAERLRLHVGWSALRWAVDEPKVRVLAMHGWEGRSTQFGALARSLGALGIEVVALDGPGHGASPEDQAHPVAFARALLDAERELGPFDAIVGHSMGGGAAILALAWGLSAQRAVVLAAPCDIDGVLGRFGGFIGLPPGVHDRFVQRMARHVGVPATELHIGEIARTLELPALVLHDPEDREVPVEDGRAIAASWRDAELVEVADVGHRRILREPGVHERIAEFLLAV